MGTERYRETPSKDYLSVVVALGKQLSTLAHPQEQIYAYYGALTTICPWSEKVYFLLPEEGADRLKWVFLCERKSQGLTTLGWQALTQDERDLLEGVAAKGKRRRKSGVQKKGSGVKVAVGDSEAVPLSLQAAIPLSGGSDPEGWVVLAGATEQKDAWGEEDLNAVSVCTDMLSASLDRARLFENVLHAKKEWERTADAIRDVVMIIDREWVVRRGNRQLAELGRVALKGLQGKKCHALLASQPEICTSCPAVATLETGEEATAEVFREEGEAVFQVWSYPILDPSGNLESVAVYEKDITEYKWMQQKLVHAEKMGVLGQLAAAVAHELNNPLSGVLSFSQILLKEMDPDLPYVEDLRNIEHAALRCKKIVEDLLAFARMPETGSHEPVGLGEVIDQTLSLLRPKLEAKGTRMDLELPSSLPALPIHPDPLHQVLVNLISNAQDALEEDGVLKLQARQAKEKGRKYVLLSVQDTGPGIPKRNMKKIFEPFFTTKGPGEGTGLGLSICRRLMESFGGSIEVSSSTAKGTTFLLKFPLTHV
ncbi:MAG: two-component system sensor histidine kinase NtrB [Thermodesulfobacteriota bacterium]